MNDIEKQNLTLAYIAPLSHACVEILNCTAIDVELAIRNMRPNINVQVLGMYAHLLSCGLTPEQIKERFIVNSHAD